MLTIHLLIHFTQTHEILKCSWQATQTNGRRFCCLWFHMNPHTISSLAPSPHSRCERKSRLFTAAASLDEKGHKCYYTDYWWLQNNRKITKLLLLLGNNLRGCPGGSGTLICATLWADHNITTSNIIKCFICSSCVSLRSQGQYRIIGAHYDSGLVA